MNFSRGGPERRTKPGKWSLLRRVREILRRVSSRGEGAFTRRGVTKDREEIEFLTL
jgi:hypothetical protein